MQGTKKALWFLGRKVVFKRSGEDTMQIIKEDHFRESMQEEKYSWNVGGQNRMIWHSMCKPCLEDDECDGFDLLLRGSIHRDPVIDKSHFGDQILRLKAGHHMTLILASEYVEDNEDHVVQRNVSSVRNDALMSILDEMHEHGVQSRLANKPDMIINDSVASELAEYKKTGSGNMKRAKCAHLTISHLKESVETVREIVEEARVVKPLDNTLNYACQYTKLSQELLEYVIGTCPKSFNERDNKAPSTPVTRKKQVTFSDKPGTSSSNTQKHEVHQKVQQTNILVIPSTGVNDSMKQGIKARSNTKKNRIMPAKKENKKEVEVHLRTNKSVWTKVNRVDSSISSKRVVINSNSESVCKTCNKCLNSASHEMCVVNILNSVNATSTVKIVLNKGNDLETKRQKAVQNIDGESFKAMNFVEKFTGAEVVVAPILYNDIQIDEMMKSSPICLLSKASKSKSWLWHRRLNHLNFGTINDLARKDLVREEGYRIYNKRTRRLMETIHVTFDEMHQSMAPVRMIHPATKFSAQVVPSGTFFVYNDCSRCHRRQVLHRQHPIILQSVSKHQELQKNPLTKTPQINHDVLHPSHNLVTGDPGSSQSSSGLLISQKPNQLFTTRSSQKMDKIISGIIIVGKSLCLYLPEN
ncbi:integrase, catalytic region, zinc finger, CCHC-type containing protein [Tanacetum coccineum]